MIAVSILALLTGLTGSALPAIPSALAESAKNYDEGQWSGSRVLLEEALADDYILVNSAGKSETKAQFVSELSDPAFRMKPFKVKHPIARVWDTGAVMGGVARLEGNDQAEAFSACLRFSDVWALRNGHWKVIYTHASRAGAKDRD